MSAGGLACQGQGTPILTRESTKYDVDRLSIARPELAWTVWPWRPDAFCHCSRQASGPHLPVGRARRGDGTAATFYEHADFKGRSVSFGAGDFDVRVLRAHIGDNTISSVTVAPGWQVTLFADPHFRGPSRILGGPQRFLGQHFNDRTSSIRIRRATQRGQASHAVHPRGARSASLYLARCPPGYANERGACRRPFRRRSRHRGVLPCAAASCNPGDALQGCHCRPRGHHRGHLDPHPHPHPQPYQQPQRVVIQQPQPFQQPQRVVIQQPPVGEYEATCPSGLRNMGTHCAQPGAPAGNGGAGHVSCDQAYCQNNDVRVGCRCRPLHSGQPAVPYPAVPHPAVPHPAIAQHPGHGRTVAWLYEQANFKGRVAQLGPGSHDIGVLRVSVGNDQVSSVRLAAGWEAVLYEHSFGGQRRVVRGSESFVGHAMNDRTSSVVIRRAGSVAHPNPVGGPHRHPQPAPARVTAPTCPRPWTLTGQRCVLAGPASYVATCPPGYRNMGVNCTKGPFRIKQISAASCNPGYRRVGHRCLKAPGGPQPRCPPRFHLTKQGSQLVCRSH